MATSAGQQAMSDDLWQVFVSWGCAFLSETSMVQSAQSFGLLVRLIALSELTGFYQQPKSF